MYIHIYMCVCVCVHTHTQGSSNTTPCFFDSQSDAGAPPIAESTCHSATDIYQPHMATYICVFIYIYICTHTHGLTLIRWGLWLALL